MRGRSVLTQVQRRVCAESCTRARASGARHACDDGALLSFSTRVQIAHARVSAVLAVRRNSRIFRGVETKPSVLARVQLIVQVLFHRRPFARDDAVHARIAQRAIGKASMVTQNAVELGPETLDCAPALMIEEVSAKLDGDALEMFECMLQEHQLALGIERSALHGLAIPRGADLDASVRRIDIHVGRHPDGFAIRIEHCEGQHRSAALQGEPPFNLGANVLRSRHHRVPKVPQLAVTYGFDEVVVVILRERNEGRVLSAQRDGLGPRMGAHEFSCFLEVGCACFTRRETASSPGKAGLRSG